MGGSVAECAWVLDLFFAEAQALISSYSTIVFYLLHSAITWQMLLLYY
jgi:hypothetical protein